MIEVIEHTEQAFNCGLLLLTLSDGAGGAAHIHQVHNDSASNSNTSECIVGIEHHANAGKHQERDPESLRKLLGHVLREDLDCLVNVALIVNDVALVFIYDLVIFHLQALFEERMEHIEAQLREQDGRLILKDYGLDHLSENRYCASYQQH